MGESFDPSPPGAVRLREIAREIHAASAPVAVEIRRPVVLADDERRLLPGDMTTVPAGVVDGLVEFGCAVRL